MRNTLAVLIAATLALAGCGGGSSGGNTRPDAPSRTVSDAYSADPAKAHSAAARAADSLPQFGSVTQSTNRGVAGITSDAASATFNGTDISLTVSREDGSRLRFNSATDTVPGYSTTWQSPIAGHRARDWGMVSYTNTTLSLGYAAVSWDNTDPTDYLAGGIWMHATGDFSAERITGIEVGAFVDGPELDGSPSLPVSGSASYTGSAVGLYAYEYGSNHANVPDGTIEVGAYEASATLTANFTANTISGCIGCVGAVYVTGVATAPDGRTVGFEDVPSIARVRLGSASIGSNGTFRNRDVTVEALGRTVTTSSGSWGGKFSNIADGVGDPRLVAGTNGARWNESDGSEGVLTGGFVATK